MTKALIQLFRNARWLLLLGMACAEDPFPQQSNELVFQPPAYFPAPAYSFADNEPTPQRTALGRRLFFDPVLSRDSSINCEHCHQQWAAFSDPLHPISHGIDNRFGFRNSPALFNLAWHPVFMADGGIVHFENMPIAPITDSNEMGDDLANVLNKLNRIPSYRADFKNAYGVDVINTQVLMRALVQYMAALVAADSRYDHYLQGNTSALNSLEREGLSLFRAHCGSCHQEPLFSDFSFRNNGLALHYADSGRRRITLLPTDEALFKVPSLRNIALTKPYMHNGSMHTLEEVIRHYSEGIEDHENLDPTLPIGGFQFTEHEQQALLAFLKSLTDETLPNDPRLDNPGE